MLLFQTQRLFVQTLRQENVEDFTQLLSDPEILAPIPQQQFSQEWVIERFNENLRLPADLKSSARYAAGVFEKTTHEMIGLALFLTNENGQREIGYRFKVSAWGKGFGTELAEAMINYLFTTHHEAIVTAEVNSTNQASVKILAKWMKFEKEFFNEGDNCTDKRYVISLEDWKTQHPESFH